MKRHSHEYPEMIVVHKGRMWARIGDEEIWAGPGDVLLYPPNVFHTERSDPNEPAETIFVGWNGDVRNWSIYAHDSGGRVRLLSQWLYDERFSSDDCKNAVSGPFLDALLAEYVKLFSYGGHSNMVQEIRRYIQDHIKEPFGLDDLAQEAGMSKYHFARTYKKKSGRTPMHDARIIRVEAARDLLITTELPLKSIASEVGLGSEYYLCRVFRQVCGVPPGYFRKKGLLPGT